MPAERPAQAAGVAAPAGEVVVRSLEQLRAKYGDPKDATYGRLRIPALDIDAPIGVRTVAKNAELPDPTGPTDVVWYDFSGWPGFGGAPGKGGNAVFAGHVDRAAFLEYAGVRYVGPGIFFSLDRLEEEDTIEVAVGGSTLRYAVVWVSAVRAAGANWGELLSANLGADAITLITCGGTFDAERHEYSHRLVVRAVRRTG